jgi:hypothetical protein
LSQIADVTEMASTSTVGSVRINLQFGLNRDINGAARAAIIAARVDLPTSLRSNPTYRKVNPADAPILLLAPTSDTMRQGELYDVASTVPSQKLSQIEGIGEVVVSAAARCRPCGSSSIRARCTNTASGWKTFARRSPRPTRTRPRGISRPETGIPDLRP